MEGKRTPLYDAHVASGGKMVEFGGYCLPVQYGTGVIREHMAVRTACGLFDVSHMGEILVEGEGAVAYLNHLLTNDYTVMREGQARYSPMCLETGGTVDDLIVCKIRDDRYFVVVNASNKDKDFAWMKEHRTEGVEVTDVSDQYAQIALQGPKAEGILRKLTDRYPEKYYTVLFGGLAGGIPCILSRTGYTGEDGFEIYIEPAQAKAMWELLLETGRDDGLIPCGLGARDTLRLEASMPLYGHELSDTITPLEAGLAQFVKLDKPGFIGREALLKQASPERRRVGLKVTGKGIIREHQEIFLDGRPIGQTTSGTHCPFLGGAYAMALVRSDIPVPGTRVEVDVRGRMVEAETVDLPFYRRPRLAVPVRGDRPSGRFDL